MRELTIEAREVIPEVREIILVVREVISEVREVILEVRELILEVREVILELREVNVEVRAVTLLGHRRYAVINRRSQHDVKEAESPGYEVAHLPLPVVQAVSTFYTPIHSIFAIFLFKQGALYAM